MTNSFILSILEMRVQMGTHSVYGQIYAKEKQIVIYLKISQKRTAALSEAAIPTLN
jgi:hypothetical protein